VSVYAAWDKGTRGRGYAAGRHTGSCRTCRR
jgi:hypothetical protein